MKTPIKAPSSKITIRQTTAIAKKRAEIEAMLTREGVEKFLNDLGRGAVEAHVQNSESESEKLGMGDVVTIQLPQFEFSGLTGLAQMLVAAKAPEKLKPLIENSAVFGKVGAGLDMAYGALRGGLKFSSKITEWDSNAEALTYVDEGVDLPKVLKSWKHTHKISENSEGGLIVDELEVEVDPAIAAPVVEGALKLHLESRAKAYKNLC